MDMALAVDSHRPGWAVPRERGSHRCQALGGSLLRRACGYSSGETAPREVDDLPLNFRVCSGAPWRAKLLQSLPEALHKVHTRRSLPTQFHLNTGDMG